MSATSDLRSEHVGVGRMLGIMDAMARRLQAGDGVSADDLGQSVEFLRVFVDQCHHTKEEQLLFPALRAAGLASVEPTIVTLLADHVQGRAGAARIETDARAMAAGDAAGPARLADELSAYTRLLHAHIRREENDCFDVADEELPADVQDELEKGYERIERDVVGEGRHEAFHAMLDRLSEAYRR